ncbi:hypothetical protein [Methylococcus sp. EFPC2]|uniref:hypothetical protein n=1 Tax=Methylococcus sp. EFPC2 TaxID=2812648 RepID=UPI0019673EBF|nr:hypothetical protein [Methylococcus sp. EFPC2]QSA97275.1 hypothetical protein JWZ97_19170 [Methylococcus sp. EFPC2]
MVKSRAHLIAVLLLGISSALPAVHAEAPKQDAAAVQALKKAQGLLRQLGQEKAALETENASLHEQLKKLEGDVKRLEPLQGEVERHKSALEGLKGANGNLESQLSGERSRGQALLQKQRETVAQARKIQADNRLLVQAVKEREAWISQCGAQNGKMLDANRELVQRYKQKGFWDKLGELEPFTGIGEVRAENAEQEYRFKLKDLSVTPFESQTPQPAPAAEPAPQSGADEEEEEPQAQP